MTAIYEVPFDDGGSRQFTLCCGACDKGCDGYIGCRACYSEIDEYLGVGDEEYCREVIKNGFDHNSWKEIGRNKSRVLRRFEKFLKEPHHKTFGEYLEYKETQIKKRLEAKRKISELADLARKLRSNQ